MTNAFNPRRRELLRGAAAVAAFVPVSLSAAKLPALDPVLADIHRRAFDYFWETGDPQTGLVPDSWPGPSYCSIAAVGFALTAYCIGAARGYVTRTAAAERTLRTLRTFRDGPQGTDVDGVIGYKGFFYHFLDMKTATRAARCELSSIDTTLFMLGALTAAAFFDGKASMEAEIRRLALELHAGVDWSFMTRPTGLVSMGWRPEDGLIERSWDRYNEGQMLYLLALGSPTHSLPASSYKAWLASIAGNWDNRLNPPHVAFSPMLAHQYTQCWYDLRGIADPFIRTHGIDYFENSRRATLAQRAYAIENPLHFKDYSGDVWGLTACQGPGRREATVDGRQILFHGYAARGPQTGDGESVDDGTLAPTAGIGSVPFAPEICIPLARTLRARYGAAIYDRYGFRDAFNPTYPADLPSRTGHDRPPAGWVSDTYIGLDQGPILLGIENYRAGSVWAWFNRSATTGPIVRRALRAAGFEPTDKRGRWLTRGSKA